MKNKKKINDVKLRILFNATVARINALRAEIYYLEDLCGLMENLDKQK